MSFAKRAFGMAKWSAASDQLDPWLIELYSAENVQGFGYRPVDDLSAVLRAGVRKPSGKEPAGARRAACRLWRFDGAASSAGVALAGAFDGRSTIGVENSSPLLPSSR